MTSRFLPFLAGVAVVCAGQLALVSGAEAANTGTVNFAQPSYQVHERDGNVTLTLHRTGGSGPATIYWYTELPSAAEAAIPGIDYTATNTHNPSQIVFAPGQTTATITVPITDHHMPTPTKHFSVKIYGAGVVGQDNVAKVEIIGDDPMPSTKIPGDPLGIDAATETSGAPAAGTATTPAGTATYHVSKARLENPLAGVKLFVDPLQPLSGLFSQLPANLYLEHGHMGLEGALQPILSQPGVMRYGQFDISKHGVDRTAIDVNNYLEEAQQTAPDEVPMLSTYDLCHNSCTLPGKGHPVHVKVPACGANKQDSAAQVTAFEDFINQLAQGISANRVILFLEEDGVITMPCLTAAGRQTRIAELQYAIDKLSQLPRAAVYVDGGAADALSVRQDAHYLNAIGVDKIQGFFLNATHADWPLNEIAYGQKISRLTHGAHFVVSTSLDGRGPVHPKDRRHNGNEILCNPPGQGLGPKPTVDTGYADVDAFAWIGDPGLQGCPASQAHVHAPVGSFVPSLALSVIRRADYKVRGTVSKRSVRLAPAP